MVAVLLAKYSGSNLLRTMGGLDSRTDDYPVCGLPPVIIFPRPIHIEKHPNTKENLKSTCGTLTDLHVPVAPLERVVSYAVKTELADHHVRADRTGKVLRKSRW